MSNNQIPIYTQEDMNKAIEAAAEANREAELTQQLLWATVQAAGGEIVIPYETWAGEPIREIAMWDDPVSYAMHLKIVDQVTEDDNVEAG